MTTSSAPPRERKTAARRTVDSPLRRYFSWLFGQLCDRHADAGEVEGCDRTFTQDEMAELLEVKQTQVSRYKTGKRTPSREVQGRLASKVLDRDPVEFLRYVQAIEAGEIPNPGDTPEHQPTLDDVVVYARRLSLADRLQLAAVCMTDLAVPEVAQLLDPPAEKSDDELAEAFAQLLAKYSQREVCQLFNLNDDEVRRLLQGFIPDSMTTTSRGILLGTLGLDRN